MPSNFQKNAAFNFWENPEKNWSKFSKIRQILTSFSKFCKKSAKLSAIVHEKIEIREQCNLHFVITFCSRLFAKFFDLRSWLSVSSPLRSVGTPSPLPRGSCSFKPGNNLEPCTDFLELCRRALHLRKSEQRIFGYQMLSATSTKRNPCSVFAFHLYSQACHTAFI